MELKSPIDIFNSDILATVSLVPVVVFKLMLVVIIVYALESVYADLRLRFGLMNYLTETPLLCIYCQVPFLLRPVDVTPGSIGANRSCVEQQGV